MIRSALLLALVALPFSALAAEAPSRAPEPPAPLPAVATQPAPAGEAPEEMPLEEYRSSVESLSERMIGSASRPVRFDWRQKTAGLAVIGSNVLELNNFNSARVGFSARTPLSGLLGELAVTKVLTWGSDSTERLALTPYRQGGRPSRWEVDLNFAFPMAEGVVTPRPGFVPAAELVFSLDAGFRYLVYPAAITSGSFWDAMGNMFSPLLGDEEIAAMDPDRPAAMEIDRGRYNVLVGGSLDVYFKGGVFLTPRVMVNVPLFTGLGWWWELSLSAGWMF